MQTELPTYTPTPLYTCGNQWCAEKYSWPAEDLRWVPSKAKWLCDECIAATVGELDEHDLLDVGCRLDEWQRKCVLREGEPAASAWMPIATCKPNHASKYTFCRIAWGPDDDRSEADGMRYGSEWFAASVFYAGGANARQYEFKEHKVTPTHWMPHNDLLYVEEPVHSATQSDTPDASGMPVDVAEKQLNQLWANGRKAWADVPDATAWVDEQRGHADPVADAYREAIRADVASIPRETYRRAMESVIARGVTDDPYDIRDVDPVADAYRAAIRREDVPEWAVWIIAYNEGGGVMFSESDPDENFEVHTGRIGLKAAPGVPPDPDTRSLRRVDAVWPKGGE